MVRFKKPTKKGVVRLQMMEGCVCNSLTVDGREEMDMTDDERREVLKTIWDSLEPGDLYDIMRTLITSHGEYVSDDEPCECCGDTVDQYTWDIPIKNKTDI